MVGKEVINSKEYKIMDGERVLDEGSFSKLLSFLELTSEVVEKRKLEFVLKVRHIGLKVVVTDSVNKVGLWDVLENFPLALKHILWDLDFGPTDRFIRYFRKNAAKSAIPNLENKVLVDVGCGRQASLGWDLKNHLKEYIGVDRDVPEVFMENVKLVKTTAETMTSKLNHGEADYVVGLAIIEHIQDPAEFIHGCKKLLKSGGTLILTTPQPIASPVLDLLAKHNIINADEILEHKTYFDEESLIGLLSNAGFDNINSEKFLLGFNCLYFCNKS
jgi:SAM-dependent methyltransferase